MKFRPTDLEGAWILEPEPRADERGTFARTWCEREAAAAGISARWVQGNRSVNPAAGTLRGLHCQAAPHAEAKLVRCVEGAVYDVIVDLRPGSPTCRRWFGVELSAANQFALFVPEGFAHGFLTLSADAGVEYLVSEFYAPEAERGVRWNDPAIGIRWPFEPLLISEKDAGWANLPPLVP